MNRLPKFLIVRFAPGAAGNMLSSLLQCSNEVAHWSEDQEHNKPNNNWLDYFKKCFPTNVGDWLFFEPIGQLNWGTRNIFSAKYPRGNDLTIDDYLIAEKKHCNNYYHQQKQNNKFLPIFWHKSNMPAYFANSVSVTITLDAKSLRWYDHAVYKKHYKIINKHSDKKITVELLENRKSIVLPQYSDQVEYTKTFDSFKTFVKTCITSSYFRALYKDTRNIPLWSIPNINVPLSLLLDTNSINRKYLEICKFAGITPVLSPYDIKCLHSYWRDLHGF